MIAKGIWFAAFLLLVAAGTPAAEIQGVLMDKSCSAGAIKDGQKAISGHTRECGLMLDCLKSGFGVVTADGKFITLDRAGNTKAAAALKSSKKKDDLKVQVTGDLQGDTIKVATLKLL